MKKILVIEDEPEMRRNITTLLRYYDYESVAAANGREGVEAARESFRLHEHLLALPNVTVEFEQLAVGDYWVGDHLIVERKTTRDFAESIIDGRLFTQAGWLAQRGERIVFLLEGGLSQWEEINMRRECLQGALITLTLLYGFPVLRSLHAEESARLMFYAAQQMQQSARETAYQHGRKPKRKRTRQLRILQASPGIGPERAEKLLDKFLTVESVISAPQADLETIEGIGPKMPSSVFGLNNTELRYFHKGKIVKIASGVVFKANNMICPHDLIQVAT
jgi:ERCC4-type nuclease